MDTRRFWVVMLFTGGVWFSFGVSIVGAAPCLIVTLTGTQGGPPAFNGLTGAGTLVRYGDDGNKPRRETAVRRRARDQHAPFAAGSVLPGRLNAVFFTHMHSEAVDLV